MALAARNRALPRTIPLRCMPNYDAARYGEGSPKKESRGGSERDKKTNGRRWPPINADENKMLIGVYPRSSAAHKCLSTTPQPRLEGERLRAYRAAISARRRRGRSGGRTWRG